MIPPSVARIVWYHPGPNDPDGCQHELAGIVTHVWNDSMVNLAVFNQQGTLFSRTSVKLCQDEQPEQYQATWMPYQIGQAAKHEGKVGLEDRVAQLETTLLGLSSKLAAFGFAKTPSADVQTVTFVDPPSSIDPTLSSDPVPPLSAAPDDQPVPSTEPHPDP